MLHDFYLQCSHTSAEKVNASWGSVMHGALLESLGEEAREALHLESLRPYAQFVRKAEDDGLTWHIHAWEDKVAEGIASALHEGGELTLRQKHATVKLNRMEHSAIGEAEWALPFFTQAEPCRKYELHFLTPSTHKQQGAHALFPTVELVLNSLYYRFGAFSSIISVEDKDALLAVIQATQIIGYRLHSAPFYLERSRVMGYQGQLTLSLTGNQQLVRLCGMLLSFAEYAGVGVKTALGMGGCEVKPVPWQYQKGESEMNKNAELPEAEESAPHPAI